jgi:hypothetical protein
MIFIGWFRAASVRVMCAAAHICKSHMGVLNKLTGAISRDATAMSLPYCVYCVLLQALRAAMELEPLLLGPITAAAVGCQHAATRRTLGEVSTCRQTSLFVHPPFIK